MTIYDTGNANGCPNYFFRKRGPLVEFYDNGNGGGAPISSIENVQFSLTAWLFEARRRKNGDLQIIKTDIVGDLNSLW